MSAQISVLVVHGPNLNLLGLREPQIYGSLTLQEIDSLLLTESVVLGVSVVTQQSNQEGTLIDAIHSSYQQYQGILINAGAYTHTSVAIADALKAVRIPTVEVHLSNIYQRESFRHHSYIAPVAIGQISGFGAQSYCLGLRALVGYLRDNPKL